MSRANTTRHRYVRATLEPVESPPETFGECDVGFDVRVIDAPDGRVNGSSPWGALRHAWMRFLPSGRMTRGWSFAAVNGRRGEPGAADELVCLLDASVSEESAVIARTGRETEEERRVPFTPYSRFALSR